MALGLLPQLPSPGPPLALLIFGPLLLYRRPAGPWLPLGMALLAGLLSGHATLREAQRDCRHRLPEGESVVVQGWLEARPVDGRGELYLTHVGGAECRGPVGVTFVRGVEAPPVGIPFQAEGRWRRFAAPHPLHPQRGGRMTLSGTEPPPAKGTVTRTDGGARALARFRGGVQDRTARVFPRGAGLVDALVLARREGVSPEIREILARAGVSHLMAISGFHVGVVAGMLLLLARMFGVTPRRASAFAAAGVAGYTLLIGAPPAALRATLLIAAMAWARLREVPVSPLAGVATPFLVMLAWSPRSLTSVGFQLSFAGAAGLVLLTRPLKEWIQGGARPRGEAAGFRARLRRGLATPLAAGIAATAATLPLALWHFHRLPVLGIPATLLLTPLIAAAIPAVGLLLLLDPLAPGVAAFLAGGVEALLALFLTGAHALGVWEWAYPWVARGTLVLVLAGMVLGEVGRRAVRGWGGGRRPGVVRRRPLWWGMGGALTLLAATWTPLPGGGGVELIMVDVGQGDGLLVRSPRGRWILVDAGPRSDAFDAGERRILPALRSAGGRRLDLLILSHPHLDHYGGAPALLSLGLVTTILDPALAVPSRGYAALVSQAVEAGVPWRAARRGDRWLWDGVEWEVLYPGAEPGPAPRPPEWWEEGGGMWQLHDPNDASVVVRMRYGDFTVLFTGDATRRVEEELLRTGALSPVTLLKVAHHGSRTSTIQPFLEAVAPQAALVSLGRENRFGHPAPEVMARLEAMGIPTLRTDESGTLRLRGYGDGSYRVISGGW